MQPLSLHRASSHFHFGFGIGCCAQHPCQHGATPCQEHAVAARTAQVIGQPLCQQANTTTMYQKPVQKVKLIVGGMCGTNIQFGSAKKLLQCDSCYRLDRYFFGSENDQSLLVILVRENVCRNKKGWSPGWLGAWGWGEVGGWYFQKMICLLRPHIPVVQQ
jgi:hypothetical protein